MSRIRIGGKTIVIRPTSWIIMFLGIFMLMIFILFINSPDTTDNAPDWNEDEGMMNLENKRHNDYREVKEYDENSLISNDKIAPPLKDKQHNNIMAMDAMSYPRAARERASKAYLHSKSSRQRPPDSKYNINVSLSDTISLDRKIDDTRPDICRTISYNIDELPRATVIMPFYNEALSMLLRTIHSVLNRSPDQLLSEIILVDDASTHEYLHKELDDYIRLLPKVKIIRNSKREGLIVSRLRGFEIAHGPIIIFLDAHTEANEGWLEPLCHQIMIRPQSVLQPFIDGIEADTILYNAPGDLYKGAFSWDLKYTWLRVTEQESKRSIETGYPFFSPTLVGCAIAVDKNYFKKIGLFDDGMKIWGGENIELAFRTWQCGGEVRTVICSRVGHVFKNFPYKFDGNKETIVQKNLMRLSDTWMDSSSKYFYAASRTYDFKRVELTEEENASLQKRKDIRKRLNCKNFDWFLYNIVPEIVNPPMDALFYGEVSNLKSKACFQMFNDHMLGMTYTCYEHKIIPHNNFALTKKGLLKYRDRCLKVRDHNPVIILSECPTEDEEIAKVGQWTLRAKGETWGHLEVRYSHNGKYKTKCLIQVTNMMADHKGEQMPQLTDCNDDNKFQLWMFTYKFRFDLVPKSLMQI